MDNAFSQALAEWTAFYALMGGAAATLLGLLFVAVSLRLNIFHQRQVADVRDFAAFTFGTFLVAIAAKAAMPTSSKDRARENRWACGAIANPATAMATRKVPKVNAAKARTSATWR